MSKRPPAMKHEDLPLTGSDALDEYHMAENDAMLAEEAAAHEIVACCKSVVRLVGQEQAKRLFAAFAKALPPSQPRPKPRGRPKGRDWTKDDLFLLVAVSTAPRGQKTATRDRVFEATRISRTDGGVADNAAKRLQRLRRDWRNEDPACRQWLIEGYFEPELDVARRPASEIFAGAAAVRDNK